MDRRFFERMQTFTIVLTVIGIIGVLILGYNLTFPLTLNSWTRDMERSFNFWGLVATISVAAGVVAAYYIMRGIAMVGMGMCDQSSNQQVSYNTPEYTVDTSTQLKDASERSKQVTTSQARTKSEAVIAVKDNIVITAKQIKDALNNDAWKQRVYMINEKNKSGADNQIEFSMVIDSKCTLRLIYTDAILTSAQLSSDISDRDTLKDCAYDVYKIIQPKSDMTRWSFSRDVVMDAENVTTKHYSDNGISFTSYLGDNNNIIVDMGIKY